MRIIIEVGHSSSWIFGQVLEVIEMMGTLGRFLVVKSSNDGRKRSKYKLECLVRVLCVCLREYECVRICYYMVAVDWLFAI